MRPALYKPIFERYSRINRAKKATSPNGPDGLNPVTFPSRCFCLTTRRGNPIFHRSHSKLSLTAAGYAAPRAFTGAPAGGVVHEHQRAVSLFLRALEHPRRS
jgi:hypothetical protein